MNKGKANATEPTNAVKCEGDQVVHVSRRKLKAIHTVMPQTKASAPKAKERFTGLDNWRKKSVKKEMFMAKNVFAAGFSGTPEP
jgi:hypothetical protein